MIPSALEAAFALQGVPFIKAVLEWEKSRFQQSSFTKGSTYEEISSDFGLFPSVIAFPVYFAGDIRNPIGKKIVVGINPGFSSGERQANERLYLEQNGMFDGYCRIFSDCFAVNDKGIPHLFCKYRGISKKYYGIDTQITWTWLQENLISLDLIPYHSVSSAGLRINDPEKFRATYFEIFLRLIRYLDPVEPIFFNGFPTFAETLRDSAFSGAMNLRSMATSGLARWQTATSLSDCRF